MKTVSFRSNSTIKDHDAPECWACAMKVTWQQTFSPCRWTASDPARAHAMWFSSPFFAGTERDFNIMGATPDFRTARQSRRAHRRAASSDMESSHGAAIQSLAQQHLLLRRILSHRRVLRHCLHDACKTLHWSPCLVVGECLWAFDFRFIDLQHEVLDCLHTMCFHRHVPQHAPLASIWGVSKHHEMRLAHVAPQQPCHRRCTASATQLHPARRTCGSRGRQSTAHCKARRRGAHGNQLRHQSPPSAVGATPATQSEGGCQWVPRLRRKTKVDVAKCHACHAKWRWMSVSATPATQSEGGCRQVPRLPRKVKVDVSECHACHAKGR